jgi:aminoglycoside phosphotransferase (APT) family kinase protein
MDTQKYQQLLLWLEGNLAISNPRVTQALGGGNSNVTLLVDTDGEKLIIRHPPVNTISELAGSGIEREAKVLRALKDYGTKVPEFKAFCADAAIIGSPFLVCEFIDGVSITDQLPGSYTDNADTYNKIGEDLVDSLANIHRLDWQQLDLPGFRASSAFLSRQLERWLTIRNKDKVRDLPLLETLALELREKLPTEQVSALIHGDYHLDNTLFQTIKPELGAIIDWELATIGDPRLDICLLLAFWGPREIDPPAFSFVQKVSRNPSAPSRESLAKRWSEITGVSLDNYHYFCAFAFWRLAAVVEGAYVLYRQGKADSEYARNLEYDVPALLREAQSHLNNAA